MKSIEKQIKRPSWSIIVLLAGVAFLAAAGLLAQSEADILGFYWDSSARSFAAASPAQNNVRYRLKTFSYYKRVAKRGDETIADSATIDYYFTGSTIDSQVVRSGNGERFNLVDLVLPDIYAYDYILQLYPNDDGRGGLAIGMDTDSADISQPTGLLIVDRNTYQMTDLYLYYRGLEDFLRFSRSYAMTEQDGYLFPDSVWVVAAKHGLLQPEHFRIETDVREIKLLGD